MLPTHKYTLSGIYSNRDSINRFTITHFFPKLTHFFAIFWCQKNCFCRCNFKILEKIRFLKNFEFFELFFLEGGHSEQRAVKKALVFFLKFQIFFGFLAFFCPHFFGQKLEQKRP